MALYIITNKTIKMANNGKGIGPRGLGAPKSMAKYGSMAKQTEPKTGDKKETEVKNTHKHTHTNPHTSTHTLINAFESFSSCESA